MGTKMQHPTNRHTHEIREYWRLLAEMRQATEAGDETELALLHAEMACIAMHAESPRVCALAGQAVDPKMIAIADQMAEAEMLEQMAAELRAQ
jgi:hypothetical protein